MSYEIDLSDKNAQAFNRDMAKYIEHAAKPAGWSARREAQEAALPVATTT